MTKCEACIVRLYAQGDTDAKLLVRRRGAAMPEDLGRGGPLAERIDWCCSVLLNLVIQTGFELTVATCRRACQNSCPLCLEVAASAQI